MQWQLQLLTNFSGHTFLATTTPDSLPELKQTVLDSSLAILALRAEVEDLKYRNTALLEETRRLERAPDRPNSEKRAGKSKAIVPGYKRPSSTSKRSSTAVPVASTSKTQHNTKQRSSGNRDRSHSPIRPIIYYSGDPTRSGSSTKERGDFASASFEEWDNSLPRSTQLAAEKRREAELKLEAERIELETNAAQLIFRCAICLEEYSEDDVARVATCEHAFCRDCLRSYIISKVNEHCYPISCPICMMEKSEEPCGEFKLCASTLFII